MAPPLQAGHKLRERYGMSRISFENYGKRARELSQDTQIAGRYQNQADAERYIFFDIVKKLKIKPTDSILDIGCGTGNVTFPLSFISQQITCVDHIEEDLLIIHPEQEYPDTPLAK